MPNGTRRSARSSIASGLVCALVVVASSLATSTGVANASDTRVPAGQVLRVPVPSAVGGKTVVGQLTVTNAASRGYVTAYGCDDGIPIGVDGRIARSDLNYDGDSARAWSNRLIAQADADGDICLYAHTSVDMIVDVNGISFDTGITSFPNRRVDTRTRTNTTQGRLGAERVLRINVPEAAGAKTVIGQLTTTRADGRGFVTAFGCDSGVPTDASGEVTKSDINFDSRVSSSRSNRLVVRADTAGDVCFLTSAPIDLVIDVNGVTDSGFTSFANRRTDTRSSNGSPRAIAARQVFRIDVPEAAGATTVIGQLTVDNAVSPGFVTAFACDGGVPTDDDDEVVRSDLNYDGRVAGVWSNRLVVQADDEGGICFYTSAAVDLIVDINGVASSIGIFSFPNQRTDTRTGSDVPVTTVPVDGSGQPIWPPFTPRAAVSNVAALTGEPVDAAIANRPIVAVKVDNFRRARPHFGLDGADVVFEQNAEGITRFMALFQTQLPTQVGPVRSARTSDLDLLSGMNRPVFGYSGANPGVTNWIRSAAGSGVLVDFTGLRSPCYSREPGRPAPHNLIVDAACAVAVTTAADPATAPGPAGPLWATDGAWSPPAVVGAVPDESFGVAMDGVQVAWTWDPVTGTYLRAQDGAPHLTASDVQLGARNVVVLGVTHVPSIVDARSPHPITVGDGVATIHRAGVAIGATWSRTTAFDPFVFRDAVTGAVIPLDVGTTFVELTRS